MASSLLGSKRHSQYHHISADHKSFPRHKVIIPLPQLQPHSIINKVSQKLPKLVVKQKEEPSFFVTDVERYEGKKPLQNSNSSSMLPRIACKKVRYNTRQINNYSSVDKKRMPAASDVLRSRNSAPNLAKFSAPTLAQQASTLTNSPRRGTLATSSFQASQKNIFQRIPLKTLDQSYISLDSQRQFNISQQDLDVFQNKQANNHVQFNIFLARNTILYQQEHQKFRQSLLNKTHRKNLE